MLGENISMRALGQKHIALLIFALSPEEELQQKSLTGEKGLLSFYGKRTGWEHFW